MAGDALTVAVRGRGAGVSNMLGAPVADEVERDSHIIRRTGSIYGDHRPTPDGPGFAAN